MGSQSNLSRNTIAESNFGFFSNGIIKADVEVASNQ